MYERIIIEWEKFGAGETVNAKEELYTDWKYDVVIAIRINVPCIIFFIEIDRRVIQHGRNEIIIHFVKWNNVQNLSHRIVCKSDFFFFPN